MAHKIGKGMTGLKHTDVTKNKMRETRIKRINEGKIKPPMLNKKHKNISKNKISKRRKQLFKEGILINPMKGKHHSIETLKKISERCGNKLDKHPNWRGGLSFEEYPIEFNDEFKQKIRKRDNWECKICNCKNRSLDVHHIDYNKKNCKEDNLITLCHSCHTKTNYNRERWIKYFAA